MEITVHGTPTKLLGSDAAQGKDAPAARVLTLDRVDYVVGSEKINTQLIVVIPSIKTEVCSLGAKKFNEAVRGIEKLEAIAVCSDSVEVVKEFCDKNCIDALKFYSDEKGDFGKRFGVLIGEGKLEGKLARAVFVIDKEGIITYREIVPEITNEANYDAALEAIQAANVKKKKGAHGHHHHGW